MNNWKTYKAHVFYRYESPYSGYSHTRDTIYTINARNPNEAHRQARKKVKDELYYESLTTIILDEIKAE